MKKNLLFLLLMAPVCLWGQTVNVNTVSELRQLADQTEVMYQVKSANTVYATYGYCHLRRRGCCPVRKW